MLIVCVTLKVNNTQGQLTVMKKDQVSVGRGDDTKGEMYAAGDTHSRKKPGMIKKPHFYSDWTTYAPINRSYGRLPDSSYTRGLNSRP
jgi:hypothetical protein